MRSYPLLTEDVLAAVPPRKRAVLKLRTGCAPLSDAELQPLRPERRGEAMAVKARSLREVADLLGVSKERVRQLENRALEKLKTS